jgi:hypothetical protein
VLCLLTGMASGQQLERSITVFGTVKDFDDPKATLNELMVVNLNSQHGFFGKSDGTFQTTSQRKDTLLVGATGYSTIKICFADSAGRDSFYVHLRLHKLLVKLKEVKVFSSRDLEAIQKDIEKLGYNKHDYELSGVNAFSSPITFLYQQFNQLEKLKRHNLERINEEKKRQLLKELLHRYVDWDIITLEDEQFDRFVDYCNVPEDFMKNSTQYDFIEYIKAKYMLFASTQK